jgi:hypothetical protein
MRSGPLMRAASLLVALASSGCMATLDGGPSRLYSISDEVALAKNLLEGAAVTEGQFRTEDEKGFMQRYYDVRGMDAASEVRRKFYRDEIIARRMYIIDIQYSEYEASLLRDRQTVGFLTSTASQGLTIGSTLAASQSAARVLSGIAGGVGAVKGIYDSELIIAKSIQIIQGQMRTQRDIVAARIADRMNWPTTNYSLPAALTDLEDYYRAGTMNTGLIRALGESGENARRAGELRGNAVVIPAGTFLPGEETSRIIREFLAPGPQRAARVAALQKCLSSFRDVRDALGRPLNINGIDRGSEFIPIRQRVIVCARADGLPI